VLRAFVLGGVGVIGELAPKQMPLQPAVPGPAGDYLINYIQYSTFFAWVQ
jgi:hypothetical protein